MSFTFIPFSLDITKTMGTLEINIPKVGTKVPQELFDLSITQLLQRMKELHQPYIIQENNLCVFEHSLNSIHVKTCDIGHSSIINMDIQKQNYIHDLMHVLKTNKFHRI